jgi:hypothetical protein
MGGDVADEPIAPPVRAVVLAVSHREWDKKDGKGKGEAWTGVFKMEDGKPRKAETFSPECAKVLEEHKDKAVMVSVRDTGRKFQNEPVMEIMLLQSEDGKVELYRGGQTKRGGSRGSYAQRPDWSYMDKAEREAERRSIEAQKAEDIASHYYAALVQYGAEDDEETRKLLTVAGAKAFAADMSKAIADRIKGRAKVASAGRSGSERRESASPQGRSQDQDGSPEPLPSTPEDFPTSGPDHSADPAGSATAAAAGELAEARNAAIAVYKTKTKVVQAWAAGHDGEKVKFEDLDADQLAKLAANPPTAPEKAEEPQPAMAAGGWES